MSGRAQEQTFDLEPVLVFAMVRMSFQGRALVPFPEYMLGTSKAHTCHLDMALVPFQERK
ncbi:hypothetical protein DPMN_173129 [Dreissena polymorpha]|uniref:Uncharacterized protein n=1 Tax=Dreissena polymorpha TaxID=45954 RepID=A0A9D4IF77_DREPO|nr:hypothetical protein DPMN_173129 [Dreissena polymorpha]